MRGGTARSEAHFARVEADTLARTAAKRGEGRRPWTTGAVGPRYAAEQEIGAAPGQGPRWCCRYCSTWESPGLYPDDLTRDDLRKRSLCGRCAALVACAIVGKCTRSGRSAYRESVYIGEIDGNGGAGDTTPAKEVAVKTAGKGKQPRNVPAGVRQAQAARMRAYHEERRRLAAPASSPAAMQAGEGHRDEGGETEKVIHEETPAPEADAFGFLFG